MNTVKIKDYFLNEAVDYASYSTLRMIASAIDGQKNTSRKVLHTILSKNIKDEMKVSVLDNTAQGFTEFLHGTMYGPIVTLAQNYTGSNNINLLKPEGNFGSRFITDPAAARYIYSCGTKECFDIFDIRDVLLEQEFEDSKIEPLFFVPNIPILAINGAGPGLASGFKQHILPRKPSECIKYLQGKKADLTPYFKGFNGKIYKGESDNQWIIEGVFTRNKLKINISEIPVGYTLKQYTAILDKLEDSKIIKYKDFSNSKTQIFNFEVTLLKPMEDEEIYDTLKLRKKISEIYNALDENNKVITFDNINQILDYYKQVRLKYQELQKQYDLNVLEHNYNIAKSKILFISLIIKEQLKIMKRNKQDIVNDLNNYNLYKVNNNYDYLLNMSIHSFTNETILKLAEQAKEIQSNLSDLQKKDINDLWGESLDKISKFIYSI